MTELAIGWGGIVFGIAVTWWYWKRRARKIVTFEDLVDAETRCLAAEEEMALLTQAQDRFTIEARTGENYKGRQYGYRIFMDGKPFIDCSTGGTGACWSIDDAEPDMAEPEGGTIVPLHVCDLDDLIGALVTLKQSGAHEENVNRWA